MTGGVTFAGDDDWIFPVSAPAVEAFIRAGRRVADEERGRMELLGALAQTPQDFHDGEPPTTQMLLQPAHGTAKPAESR